MRGGWRAAIVFSLIGISATAVQAQSDTKAARIGHDIISNMAGSTAFDQLRQTACSDENARVQLGAALTKALGCQESSSTSANPGRTFSEDNSAISFAQGTWTTQDPASCRSRWYTWVVAGSIGMSEFKDQFAQIDIERTIEVRQNVLVTETIDSFHPRDGKKEVFGTRWMYVFLDQSHVQVRNLRTGRTFTLTRC